MRKHPALTVLGIVVAILAGVGVYLMINPDIVDNVKDSFRGTETISEKEQIDGMVIAFVGSPFQDDYNMLRVPGYLDNNSESDIKSASIQIQLLDEAGNKKELIDYVIEDITAKSRETYDVNAGTIPPDRTATIQVVELVVYQ